MTMPHHAVLRPLAREKSFVLTDPLLCFELDGPGHWVVEFDEDWGRPLYIPDMNPIEMVFSQNQSLPEREPVRVVRSNCAPVAHAPFRRTGVRVTGPPCAASPGQACLQSCASGTRSVSTRRSAGHRPACADSPGQARLQSCASGTRAVSVSTKLKGHPCFLPDPRSNFRISGLKKAFLRPAGIRAFGAGLGEVFPCTKPRNSQHPLPPFPLRPETRVAPSRLGQNVSEAVPRTPFSWRTC